MTRPFVVDGDAKEGIRRHMTIIINDMIFIEVILWFIRKTGLSEDIFTKNR